MAKKSSKSTRRTWKPHAHDAIRLAALRWYALTIERLAIDIYATDPRKFEAMAAMLRRQTKELFDLGRGPGGALKDNDCPDGYFLCKDGLCAPMCDPSSGGIDS